ncbi:MAG: DUF3267 domain-containing protein [Solobacterium sp.]|nr:DUF3267 domain-containing protein [Solobacterium sp.]
MSKKTKNDDQTERKLSPQEQERLQSFQAMSSELRKQGYRQISMVIGIDKANKLAIIMVLPLLAVGMVLFVLLGEGAPIGFRSLKESFLFLAGVIILTIAHELVHGITWSLFSPNHFNDIEFGFMKETLTPYCTCRAPLGKKEYILGTIMPLIMIGVIPTAAGILTHSFMLMLLGIIMISGAAGDIMIINALMKHHSDCSEQIICDLPVQAGCMLFER